jgi:hypothetical protein
MPCLYVHLVLITNWCYVHLSENLQSSLNQHLINRKHRTYVTFRTSYKYHPALKILQSLPTISPILFYLLRFYFARLSLHAWWLIILDLNKTRQIWVIHYNWEILLASFWRVVVVPSGSVIVSFIVAARL